ncbi:MAG TPA: glutaminyl-peptide cyclotransferase [Puia sp.]|nr:glutaminyl-peptide cyclotransferase [Puia sp.]
MNKLCLYLLIGGFLDCGAMTACNNSPNPPLAPSGNTDNTPPTINYSVIKAFPHDTSAYTEGFLFHDGQLFESTGTEAADMPDSRRSLFGTVDLNTGRITPKAELDRQKYFGEGIVFLQGKIYQLTYTTKIGFIYDAKTFKKIGEFTFPNREGWGMTTDGKYIIMSDGSSEVSYYSPDSMAKVSVSIHYDDGDSTVKTLNSLRLVKVLNVTDNNGPVVNVNELEMIHGYLYANQWQTNYILKIDTATGKVVGRLNLDSIAGDAKSKYAGAEWMNGIAYDSATNKVYITGKLWPSIYQINFAF